MKVCPTCGEVYGDERQHCDRDGTPLKGVRDPLVGRTVGGRYRLISRLGSGGMSAVYLARHTLIDRLVAVKTLRRELAQDPIQRDRFIREARAVNRINHQNIVEISDYGETEDGLVYLVMEYVPGESLLKTLAKGPMDEARVLHIAEQIGGALARAHQMGVVHRDLKPENLLLMKLKKEGDFIKILDFGIAKILDAPSLTGSQQIFGTPGYIAPEYIQSTDIDGRADLYSLGVILYELVTGALPFDYEYPGDLLVKHVTEQPIAPSVRREGVSAPMEALILKCLRKDPDERFRDAYHFLDEVAQTRERMGTAGAWGSMSRPVDPTDPSVDLPDDEDEKPDLVSSVRQVLDTMVDDGRATLVDLIPNPPELLPSNPEELKRPEAPDHGLAGARRWRDRFDALASAVESLRVSKEVPKAVVDALRFGRETLASLESGVVSTESHQKEIESLSDEARDFRATLGRAIDQVAQRLSKSRRDFEELAAHRRRLREKRDGLLSKMRRGDEGEGAADAVLWELAKVEEEFRRKTAECDETEAQLERLRHELESRNEAMEGRLAELVATADREMIRLDNLADALREPLDRIESFVQETWGL